ncbi:MAG: 50S ribosomal protein L5 [Candidatus Omnitrophota bacterium]
MAARLLEKYRNEITAGMSKAFNLSNRMAVPYIEKIVVNMGVGEALQDVKILDKAAEELGLITGQKPVIRRAKKAISNFKIKQGNPVGCKVTLRSSRMYEFMDKLINIALPRIRDFRGVPADSFDHAGNYTLGITDQTIFPEIDIDKTPRTQGMEITFVIKKSKNKEYSRELLRLFGMPFKTED